MKGLNIGKIITKNRRDRGITQTELAEYIGVSKASVSKWETGQSTPDITILPQLAAFFDISIDELIGYEPQLSKEQIQKLIREFIKDFACCPFDEVMTKTQTYVKKYYSCYPFLFQVCALWLNHYTLANDPDKMLNILKSVYDLCDHIKTRCQDMGICNDIILLQAMVSLQLNRPQDVIDSLEKTYTPTTINTNNQRGLLLSKAYIMTGNMEKADSFTQISMYGDILSLLGNATHYLSIHANDFPVCEQTILRIDKLIDAYALSDLHPNNTCLFEYQAAICYLLHDKKDEALMRLEKYVSCLIKLFSSYHLMLHGDDYFNKIDEWFARLEGGAAAPRDRKLVAEDITHSFEQPVFTALDGEPAFERLKKKIKEIGK